MTSGEYFSQEFVSDSYDVQRPSRTLLPRPLILQERDARLARLPRLASVNPYEFSPTSPSPTFPTALHTDPFPGAISPVSGPNELQYSPVRSASDLEASPSFDRARDAEVQKAYDTLTHNEFANAQAPMQEIHLDDLQFTAEELAPRPLSPAHLRPSYSLASDAAARISTQNGTFGDLEMGLQELFADGSSESSKSSGNDSRHGPADHNSSSRIARSRIASSRIASSRLREVIMSNKFLPVLFVVVVILAIISMVSFLSSSPPRGAVQGTS